MLDAASFLIGIRARQDEMQLDLADQFLGVMLIDRFSDAESGLRESFVIVPPGFRVSSYEQYRYRIRARVAIS